MYNPLNAAFSLYLQNIFSFDKCLTDKNLVFKDTIEKINNKNLLDYNFLNNYKLYPKYPIDFKPIINLYKYNLLKIYDSYDSKNDYLFASITDTDILNLKLKLDKIPTKNIKEDLGIQTIFFEDLNTDVLDTDRILIPIRSDSSHDHYLFKMFGNIVSNQISKASLTTSYVLYTMLSVNFKSVLELFGKMQTITADYSDSVNSDYVKSFSNYVDTNIESLSTEISNFLLSYTYQISNPSGNFYTDIKNIIADKLKYFKTRYSLNIKKQNALTLNSVKQIVNMLYMKLAEYYVHYFINDVGINSTTDSIVNAETDLLLLNSEVDKYNYILENKYTPESIRYYLYLTYMYKNYPQKFLNSLQLVLQYYTENELRKIDDALFTENITDDTLYKEFTVAEIMANIVKLLGTQTGSLPESGLKLSVICNKLNTTLDNTLLLKLLKDNQTISYGFRSLMAEHLESYCEDSNTNEFDIIINDLFDSVFDYLKSSVQIKYNFDYYYNKKLLKWYFRSLLRRDLLNNTMFVDRETEMYEIFNAFLENRSNTINFSQENMRTRTLQFLKKNILEVQNFFENILTTSLEKYLHNTHIMYYLANVDI